MRRLLSSALFLSLLCPASLAWAKFSDVPANHPYAEAIADVQAKGIVSGYSDGTYRPNQNINRAEFTKILTVAVHGQQTIVSKRYFDTPGFLDVDPGDWFEPYVHFAWDSGIIAGYSDNTFRPAANINFAEAAKIIVLSYDVSFEEDIGTEWWEQYVEALRSHGALPSSFRSASQLVTRGEMAAMIHVFLDGTRSTDDGISATSSYRAYEDGVIGNGQESVLFFYAAWCPYCQANDHRLLTWSGPLPVTVYKVDYDAETELKNRYGIATQDTFIRIDGTGKEIARLNLGASKEQLQAFLEQ